MVRIHVARICGQNLAISLLRHGKLSGFMDSEQGFKRWQVC
jgi:hypothetical protein